MKKLLFFVSLIALCISLPSCEKAKDVVEGTWKFVPDFVSSSGWEENVQMTYYFDGKGNYTFVQEEYDFIWSSSKGTYVIEGNNTIVRLHGVSTNAEGFSKEYDSELMLDLTETPPTLSAHLYDNSGSYYGLLVFVKQ